MGQMQGLLIAMVLFSGVAIAIASFYAGLASNYGVAVTNVGYLNRSVQLNNKLSEIAGQINSSDPDSTTSFNPLSAFNAIAVGFSSLDLFTGIVTDATDRKNTGVTLDPWVPMVIISIITIVLAFAIINALYKWNT